MCARRRSGGGWFSKGFAGGSFYKALSGRMLNNGLFARTLVLDAAPRSRGRMPSLARVPQAITDTATWWSSFNPGGVRSGNLSGFFPEPVGIGDVGARNTRFQVVTASSCQ
jgi:hypothetical protein